MFREGSGEGGDTFSRGGGNVILRERAHPQSFYHMQPEANMRKREPTVVGRWRRRKSVGYLCIPNTRYDSRLGCRYAERCRGRLGLLECGMERNSPLSNPPIGGEGE
jgi:hypothetical protein